MKLKDRFQIARKILFSQELGRSVGSVMRNYAKDQGFAPQRQLRGITYKAVDKIGQSVSDYKPLVEKKNGDTLENHPIYVLSSKPNPRQTGVYFHHLEAMLYEIYGETFWYIVRGESTNRIKELYLLNPAQMELVIEGGELVGYKLHKNDGNQVPFELDEIHHDKRPNPFNEWRGMSVMERASQYVDIEIVTTSFTLNYMNNNASPSGIVSLPDMNSETFKQFAQQWREGYEGPENAGKTAFIRGGEASFKAVGATLKDVDQKITRDMAKDDVLMMFDMPKGLLGMAGDKGLGRSESEALEYIFAKWKVQPMMKRLDAIYDSLLLEFTKTEAQGSITHTSPVPEDKEYILNVNEKGVDKWITRNEARQAQGLPPIPGGDVLPPIQTSQATTQTKAKKIVLKQEQTKGELAKKLNQNQENFRQELVTTNEVYEKKAKKALVAFTNTQKANVLSKLSASRKAFDEWLFNLKDESVAMASALTPIIIELMEAQTEDVANFISGELLTISPEIRNTVENNILKISGLYNEDTYKALEATLSEGQTAGESVTKLTKRVEQVYSDASGYRAERIAKTETIKASNRAAELTYKQSGYTTIEWFTNPGACEFCKSYDGKTKTIGSIFTKVGETVTGADGSTMLIGYDDIDVPPLHPNCKCSIVPAGDN
jgi:HK97 family phage portal protein